MSETHEHPGAGPVELVLEPKPRDLGGFTVRRSLPTIQRRHVGPFVFFDEMGPALFAPGEGLDVAPHPHIGLSTLTYLFDGVILHRDSLGAVQPIEPGATNWMTAGRGIVHSERTPPEARARGGRLHGVQVWLALPKAHEDTEPSFVHHPADTHPLVADGGVRVRVLGGSCLGVRAPAQTLFDLVYADIALDPGARFQVPSEPEERALYVVDGSVEIAGVAYGGSRMLVLAPRREVVVAATGPSRLLLLGGPPLDGRRHIWWNFVHSSRERIQEAAEAWEAHRFPQVPGDPERIPLPGERNPVVRYP